jgi:hypothetical protein
MGAPTGTTGTANSHVSCTDTVPPQHTKKTYETNLRTFSCAIHNAFENVDSAYATSVSSLRMSSGRAPTTPSNVFSAALSMSTKRSFACSRRHSTTTHGPIDTHSAHRESYPHHIRRERLWGKAPKQRSAGQPHPRCGSVHNEGTRGSSGEGPAACARSPAPCLGDAVQHALKGGGVARHRIAGAQSVRLSLHRCQTSHQPMGLLQAHTRTAKHSASTGAAGDDQKKTTLEDVTW